MLGAAVAAEHDVGVEQLYERPEVAVLGCHHEGVHHAALAAEVRIGCRRLAHAATGAAGTLGVYARATEAADRAAAEVVGDWFRPPDGRAMEGDSEQEGLSRNSP